MANFTSILTGKQVESLLANYATCATAGSTAAKVATISSINGATPQFELFTGLTVRVKFTNSNTVASPTLNVNSTGAKPIVRYGTTAPSTTAATSWSAGAIVSLTYDGTNWVMNDNNTGDMTGVTAGSGLTGGGTSGAVTLNVGAGNGISVTADAVSAKAGSGITVDTTGINVNTSFTTSAANKKYKVQVDSTSGGLFVNVPWQNDNTTYTAGEGIKIIENQIIAKEHTHTAAYTPAGTVSQPTFTGNTVTSTAASEIVSVAASDHSHGVQAAGTVDLDISEVTSGGNYQPKGTVSGSFTGTAHKHTFTGTAAKSTKPDTENVSTVYSITGVGSAPSLTKTDTNPSKITEWSAGTLPSLTTKSEEVSLISSWSEGTLPTTTNITYVSGGSKSTVLTGVTHSGTTSVATGVTQGSGALVAYSEDNTNSAVKYDGETDKIPVIHDITTTTTQVSTGAKATSTGSAAPNEHTHTYTKATGVNLGSNDTATNGVQYVESITSTKASASSTAKVGSETHTHSHTPSGSVALSVAATESDATAWVVTSVSKGSVSTSALTVAPHEHTHDITISGTTGANSGTAVAAVTGVGANGTATVLTGVAASSAEDFLVSLTNGSGSLTSDSSSTDGITYVESVTHSAASLTGTKTFNTNAIKDVTLSASTTSTDGPKYIEDVTHTAASLTGTTTFNTDAIKKVAIVAAADAEGDVEFVHSITGSAPTLTGDTTFVKSVSGGSGSLVAYDASSGGNAKTTNGNRIPFITTLAKDGYTPAGSVTLTAGTAPSMNFNTGTNTDTPYIASISGGSAVSKTTKYMKFSAGTTPVESATFSGSAVTSGGASATTTSSAGANTSATSNTGSAGAGSSANTGASTTISDASVSAGVLTITKSSHTHSYSKPAAHTHTYYAPVAHTHTLSHTHSVTAAGTISLTRGTAPSMNFDTDFTSDTPYISEVSGGSAVSATTKYMKFSAGTTPKSSASFSGTKSTAVVTGGTTYYLAHSHTAASSTTGTVGISGGSYVGNMWGLALDMEKASTGTVGISGGSISKTTRYMKRTTTAAGTGTVGISGGSISPVTKYLHHTHTPTTAGDIKTAITGVASSGTTTVLTGVKATSTASVAPSGHSHSYGSSTALTTAMNPGTGIDAITEVTYTAPTHTRKPLQATFTGTASNTGGPSATTAVVTGVTGGTTSATKKYFHPSITTESANTGKNSGTGIVAVTGVGNNGLVDVISTVSGDQGWLKHTHTSAKASGTSTAITGVKSNGTADAYTSLDTASAKAVKTVGSLPSLDYTDLTVLTQDSWSAGTLPSLKYATEASTKIDSWSAGSVPTRSVIYVPNSEHTHNVTATGTIGDTTAGGTISATFTGKQVLIEPTFIGDVVGTSMPDNMVNVASSDHTHTVKATGTVSKPSFTGTATTISSGGPSYEEDN